MATYTPQQADQANQYLKSGNYQDYYKMATAAGFSDADTSAYASLINPNITKTPSGGLLAPPPTTVNPAPTTQTAIAPATNSFMSKFGTSTTQAAPVTQTYTAPKTPSYSPDQALQANEYLKSGNYQDYYNMAKQAGFSDTDTSAYASLVNPNINKTLSQSYGTPNVPITVDRVGQTISDSSVAAFRKALEDGNWAGAATLGKQYAFTNKELADYAAALNIPGVNSADALSYLNQVNPGSGQPISNEAFLGSASGFGPFTMANPTGSLYDQKPATLPSTSNYYNNTPQVTAAGEVNVGTAMNPYYVNPMLASGTANLENKFMTPEQYSLLQSKLPTASTSGFAASNSTQQNQQIMNFAKANGITPDQAQVYLAGQSQNINPNSANAQAALSQVQGQDLSQNQLANITKEDSPLMQLSKQSGLRLAAGRNLLNSSIGVGAAQAEMIKAAQPFALQDAQTYSNTRLANQQAENQARLANQGIQKDFSLANQSQANQVNLANAQTQNQNAQYNTTNSVNADMQAAQAGFDAAKQNSLQNNDALNKADLAKLANQLDMNAAYSQNAQAASGDLNKANIDARQAIQTAILDRANSNVTAANQSDLATTGQAQKNESAVLQNELNKQVNAQLASFDVAKVNNQNYYDSWKTQFDKAAAQQLQAITDNAAMARQKVQTDANLYQTDVQRQNALDQINKDMKIQAVTSSTNLMNTFTQQFKQISVDKEVPPEGKENTLTRLAEGLVPQINQLNKLAGIPTQYTAQTLIGAIRQVSPTGANPTADVIGNANF